MYTKNMYIFEVTVFVIIMISRNNGTNCDFFLSKQKATLERAILALYVVIYFKKNFLLLSHFFDPCNKFVIKSSVEFGLFSEKIGDLSGNFLLALANES